MKLRSYGPDIDMAPSIAEYISIFALSLSMIIGRWTPSRLMDTSSSSSTLLMWVLPVIALFFSIFGARPKELVGAFGQWWSILALLGAMLLSALWTNPGSDTYFVLKVNELCTLVICTVALLTLLRTPRLMQLFLTSLFALCLIVTLFGVGTLLSTRSAAAVARASALGGGPNVFARLSCLTGLLAFVVLRGKARPLAYAAAIVAAIGLLSSGSRGAAIGAIVTGLAFLLDIAGGRIRLSTTLIRAGGAGLFAAALLTLTPQFGAALETFHQRVYVLTIQEKYTAGRTSLFSEAWSDILRSPILGHGLAYFQSGRDVYAHNIFLEVWSEAGLLALCFLLITVVSIIAADRVASKDHLGRVLKYLTLFFLIASSSSGDIFDSRYFLLFAGIFISYSRKLAAEHRPSPGPGQGVGWRRVGPVGAWTDDVPARSQS